MERFSAPIALQHSGGETWITPDSVLGTDSHTTMVNDIGVLGWGIGGIEATDVVLGNAVDMLLPRVIGVRLQGSLRKGVLAIDAALSLTERLRAEGAVDAVLEFHGPGFASLSAEDRATLANKCPEYGASSTLFPFDERTAWYFARVGHSESELAEARSYLSLNGLNADHAANACYDDLIDFYLSAIGRVVAGPFGPAQKCDLGKVGAEFACHFHGGTPDLARDARFVLTSGDMVLAAITSCTNTANPSSMVAAGHLARAARRTGLSVRPAIKCTMVLGSRESARILERTGLREDLAALGFPIDGFGCGACVGNAGELLPDVERALAGSDLAVAAVLSGQGNRFRLTGVCEIV